MFWVIRNRSLPSPWSSARERWDALGSIRPGDPAGGRLDVLLEAMFVGHGVRRMGARRGGFRVLSGFAGARLTNPTVPHSETNAW